MLEMYGSLECLQAIDYLRIKQEYCFNKVELYTKLTNEETKYFNKKDLLKKECPWNFRDRKKQQKRPSIQGH